jgi:hypothetical protein
MLMVDNASIMAHRDAELEGGGDHLIDRLLVAFQFRCDQVEKRGNRLFNNRGFLEKGQRGSGNLPN